jgi:molybdenum cofactor cytidylyltransferase
VIAALLLAAGAARRFGSAKLLQELNGKPIVRWSAEALRAGPVDTIIVVIPPENQELHRALDGLDARFVVNPRPDDGMGSSLACGVSSLEPGTEAVLVALADEPMLGRDVLSRVVERYRAGDVDIVAPKYRGIPGHPVLFGSAVFDELRVLTGDRGARAVVDRDPDRVATIELEERPIDVDTPADLARLRQQAHYISPSTPRS